MTETTQTIGRSARQDAIKQDMVDMLNETIALVREGKISAEQAKGACVFYDVLMNSGFNPQIHNVVRQMHNNTVAALV